MNDRAFYRSKSQLNQYERCPRAFEWNYIKKVKLMSYFAAKGIACHEAIAAHFRRKAETGAEPAPTEALAVFHDKVKEFFSPLAEAEGRSPVLFEGQSREKLEAEGVAQLTTYLKVLAPTIEPLMVEEAVDMTLPGGMRIRGRIDLVDTACRIRDAKFPTDGMKAEQLHYEADAPLYCAFYRALTGRWPSGFVFDVVALGRKKMPEPTATSLDFPDFETYMPALVEARLADLERVDEGIKAGIFHRRPSVMNCNLCVFTNLCWHGMKAGIGVHSQAERESPSLEPALRMSLVGMKDGHASAAEPPAEAEAPTKMTADLLASWEKALIEAPTAEVLAHRWAGLTSAGAYRRAVPSIQRTLKAAFDGRMKEIKGG